jgi:hypothetical protein
MDEIQTVEQYEAARKILAQRVLDAYRAGKLQTRKSCQYRDRDGKCCAVGFLMSDEDREIVVNAGFNSQAVDGLEDRFSTKAMTGLAYYDAKRLQSGFDNPPAHHEMPDDFLLALKDWGAE